LTQASNSTSAVAPNIIHTQPRMFSGMKLTASGLTVSDGPRCAIGTASCIASARAASSARACARSTEGRKRATPWMSRYCCCFSCSGIHKRLACGKPKSAGNTPITVAGAPFTCTARPTMRGSAWKSCRHSDSPRSTTGAPPGTSSEAMKPRPRTGFTPSNSIIEAVSRAPRE
jgi:hypothetical protein